MRPAFASKQRQHGLTLVGMAIATALLAIVVTGIAVQFARYERQQSAGRDGQALAQMATGLTGYIDAVQGGTVHLLGNPEVETGFAWLKPPTCGGLPGNPTAGFVPCSFDPGADSGLFLTEISSLPASNTTQAVAMLCTGTVATKPTQGGTCPGPNAGSQARQAMLMQAGRVAQAARASAPPHDAGFVSAFSNTPLGASAQYDPQQVVSGNPLVQGLVMLVVSDAPSQDPWLRTDGSNQMLANLNVGGHDVDNAAAGTFSGQVSTGSVQDAGALNVNGNAAVQGSSYTGGNATFGVPGTGSIVNINGPAEVQHGLTVNGVASTGGFAGDNAMVVDGNVQIDNMLSDWNTFNRADQEWVSNMVDGENVRYLTGADSYVVPEPTCQAGAVPAISVSIRGTGNTTPAPAFNRDYVVVSGTGPWIVVPEQQPLTYTVTGQLSSTGALSGSLNPFNGTVVPEPSMELEAFTWCQG